MLTLFDLVALNIACLLSDDWCCKFSCLLSQVCVVFSLALKSWCRAVVESVFQGTVDTQVWCLLVDHGDRIIVGAEEYETFCSSCLIKLPPQDVHVTLVLQFTGNFYLYSS